MSPAIRVGKQPRDLWEVSVLPGESSAIEPLLDLAVIQANAQGAYLYRFDRQNSRATLAALAGPAPDSGQLPGRIAALHWNRRTPVVLHAHTAADWRFTAFPEFQTGRFEGVVSLPLLDAGEAVGLANFCRTTAAPWSATALSFLMSLSLPLGALLAASSLREQLDQATRELAGRKVVERAKGLLQARYQWTEEEAYLCLRRWSRQRRQPMREIARAVIESGLDDTSEADRHD